MGDIEAILAAGGLSGATPWIIGIIVVALVAVALYVYFVSNKGGKARSAVLNGELVTKEAFLAEFGKGKYSEHEPGCFAILFYEKGNAADPSKYCGVYVNTARDIYGEVKGLLDGAGSEEFNKDVQEKDVLISFDLCRLSVAAPKVEEMKKGFADRLKLY